MATIGQQLSEARRSRGLSVEDVAHATHVRAHVIRDLENDDFSGFPSVTYAKGFVRSYGEFLGNDLSDTMAALESAPTPHPGEPGSAGKIGDAAETARRFRFRRSGGARGTEKPGGAPVFLNAVLGLIVGSLAVFYFFGYHAATPEEAKAGIARGLERANPFTESPAAGGAENPGADSQLPANPIRAANEGVSAEAAAARDREGPAAGEFEGDSPAMARESRQAPVEAVEAGANAEEEAAGEEGAESEEAPEDDAPVRAVPVAATE